MIRHALATALLCLAAGAAFAQDHSQHQQHAMQQSPPAAADEHAQHREQETNEGDSADYRSPALTDADRVAAFPNLSGHDMSGHMDDDPFVWMAMADRFEWQDGDALAWDAKAWFGHDSGRLWLRSEGERERGHATEASIEALWGKPLTPWWDVLAGVRYDSGEGDSQEWLALGVQGMAPYKFEVQATAYLGEDGRTALQAEAEYDLLLTNRLILQPRIEAVAHGRSDVMRGIGAGLGETEAGLRLRYEIRREFAPYLGIERTYRFGKTADFARAAGEPVHETRWVFGIRAWF